MTTYCVYYEHKGAGRSPNPAAGPFELHEEALQWLTEQGLSEDEGYVIAPTAITMEHYAPLELLSEIMTEAGKVPLRKAARSVYHRDYLKTKNRPYRKYDPKKHKGE